MVIVLSELQQSLWPFTCEDIRTDGGLWGFPWTLTGRTCTLGSNQFWLQTTAPPFWLHILAPSPWKLIFQGLYWSKIHEMGAENLQDALISVYPWAERACGHAQQPWSVLNQLMLNSLVLSVGTRYGRHDLVTKETVVGGQCPLRRPSPGWDPSTWRPEQRLSGWWFGSS